MSELVVLIRINKREMIRGLETKESLGHESAGRLVVDLLKLGFVHLGHQGDGSLVVGLGFDGGSQVLFSFG
jgi:hypothetical protein